MSEQELILQKIFSAYGGKEKLESIQNISSTFDFSFFQPNGTSLSGEGKEVFQVPNQNLFEFNLPNVTMLNGSDGEAAWQKEGGGDVLPIDLERFVIHTRLRRFPLILLQDELDWSYKGEVELDDLEKVLWVSVKYSDKEKASYYLDPETFLLRRYQGPSRSMGMKVTTVIQLDDYHSFDGYLFPTHQTFLININKFQERRFKEFKINQPIDKQIFQPKYHSLEQCD